MGRGDGEGRWRWGKWEGGDEEGQKEGGVGEFGKGEGENKGQEEGGFTDGYEMLGWTYGMPVWNEVTELFDFVYPCNAGYPS